MLAGDTDNPTFGPGSLPAAFLLTFLWLMNVQFLRLRNGAAAPIHRQITTTITGVIIDIGRATAGMATFCPRAAGFPM
jgi:hypothetical protein